VFLGGKSGSREISGLEQGVGKDFGGRE